MQALALAVGRHVGEAERVGPRHAAGQARRAVDRRRCRAAPGWRRRGRAAGPPAPGRPGRRCPAPRPVRMSRSTSRIEAGREIPRPRRRSPSTPVGVHCGKRSPGSRPTISRTSPAASVPASGRSAVHAAVLQHGDVLAERASPRSAGARCRGWRRPRRAAARSRSVRICVSCRRQRRGRLVEDEHARLAVERLGDLDHLAAAERQVADRRRQRLVEADQLAGGLGPRGERAVVDQAEAAWDRRRGRYSRRSTGWLVRLSSCCTTAMPALPRLAPASCARRARPSISIVPPSGGKRARQEVDQRRLARAVLAEQRMDAARLEGDRDVAQHGVAEERLRHPARGEQRSACVTATGPSGLLAAASSLSNSA